MRDPDDMTPEEIDRLGDGFDEWHAEHSISIPANEASPLAIGFTVWDEFEFNGRCRLAMGRITATGLWGEEGVAT